MNPRLEAQLQDARRALLIRLRSLGDAVLMTPVPTALKAWRPSLRVAVLVEEPFAAVFHHHPAVDEVVSLPLRSGLRERLRCAFELRRAAYDMVFNMHSGSTAGLLTALSGAPLRIAYRQARFAAGCNVRIRSSARFWGASPVHTVLHQLTPLLALGIPAPEKPSLALRVDPQARGRVRKRLAAMGLRSLGFILLQPFANWVTKEWPPQRFAALARELRERYRLPIVVLAGPAESRRLERLQTLADGALLALRDVAVADLIAWIEQCALLVGNDSGPAHVAAALGKPKVVIFGSTDPQVWRPWSGESQLLLPDLPCIPCGTDGCSQFESPRCIESISVPQVFEAVARLLPSQPTRGAAIASPPRETCRPG